VNRIQKTVFTILMVDLCGILYLQHLLEEKLVE